MMERVQLFLTPNELEVFNTAWNSFPVSNDSSSYTVTPNINYDIAQIDIFQPKFYSLFLFHLGQEVQKLLNK